MSNIIQVTNIATTVSEDNIKTLFSFVGAIREMIVYFENAQGEETKVAYIVFESNSDAETSLHLHNTVFHDRALIILPLAESCKGQIPDIAYAKMIRAPEKTVTGIAPKSKSWPSDVISMVVGRTGEQSILTIEPNFIKQGLPNYPKLPYSTEVSKIDEIRRTVLVTNLNPGTSSQQVLDFFQPVAEVKFIRMAGSEHDNAAYVEFSEQSAVAKAFGMMGTDLNGRAIMIQHSNVAISKPGSGHKGLEDGRRARASISKSRSHSRTKHRSRSRGRRPSKSRRRSRSKKGSKPRTKRRSRSPRRSGSRHRREKKSTSRVPREHKKRSASKEKEKKKERSRSRHRRPRRDSKSAERRARKERPEKVEGDRREKIDGGERRERPDKGERRERADSKVEGERRERRHRAKEERSRDERRSALNGKETVVKEEIDV